MGHAWFSSVAQTEVPKQTAWVGTIKGSCLSTAGFHPFRKATPPSQLSTRTGTLAAAVARLTAVFCWKRGELEVASGELTAETASLLSASRH